MELYNENEPTHNEILSILYDTAGIDRQMAI
jgi:hypothetical protein